MQNSTITQIKHQDLRVGDHILNYRYEKTPMVVIQTISPFTGNFYILLRRLNGKKEYGSTLPMDHLFLVERSDEGTS